MKKIPTILVSGVAQEPMSVVSMSLLWDVPNAVAVRHDIDVDRSVLVRTVSDMSGVIERVEVDIEHMCAHCAIREDIIPTLERLGATGSWDTIIAQLPPAIEARNVCQELALAPDHAPHVEIGAVLAALEGETVVELALGGGEVGKLGVACSSSDDRGIGEVTSAIIEFCDLVVHTGSLDQNAHDLLGVLTGPHGRISPVADVQGGHLVERIHDNEVSEAWVAEVRRNDLVSTPPENSKVWVLDFRSDRPFHPERMWENIELLGRGERRARGCFWLPTRAGSVLLWDGAGGQLRIGTSGSWGWDEPITRIVITGIDHGKEELEQALKDCLLTDEEIAERGTFWESGSDGLEPWLGPIRYAA